MREYKTREASEGLSRRNTQLSQRVESLLSENAYQTVQLISVDRLIPFKNQQRIRFDQDKLNALAATIKEHGIRQPLTVIKSEQDPLKYEIVSGERRYRAAVSIGMDKVPCIAIRDRRAAEEIALIENIQRENLHPIELGRAYKHMLSSGIALSQADLSDKIGVPRVQINEYLNYADLPDETAAYLIEQNIFQRDIIRKIVKCKSKDEVLKIVYPMKNPAAKKKKLLEVYVKGGEINCNLADVNNYDQMTILQLENKLTEILNDLKKRRTGVAVATLKVTELA